MKSHDNLAEVSHLGQIRQDQVTMVLRPTCQPRIADLKLGGSFAQNVVVRYVTWDTGQADYGQEESMQESGVHFELIEINIHTSDRTDVEMPGVDRVHWKYCP